MKILIAEDEKIARMILVRALEDHGYEVLQAENGRKGWDIYQREKEDIYFVVLDWQMPKMDGLELCRRIKNTTLSHYVYVIFLTGQKDTKSIVRGLEIGADDYLTKPFNKRELLSRIKVGLRIIESEKALQEANKRLEMLACTDGLTGVSNRRALLDRLRSEFSRAAREKVTFCLFMMDIDHFKSVNDTYGHDAGDRVLIEVANRIQCELRPYDIMGRYGGEEFLAGVVNVDSETGKAIGERLRSCVCRDTFQIGNEKVSVSISVGVTNCVISKDNNKDSFLVDMIKRADQALYEAKDTGRNRVVFREM